MDLGDFEQDVWGTQLCSVWLLECLNFQVSDIRSEKEHEEPKMRVGWLNQYLKIPAQLPPGTGGH